MKKQNNYALRKFISKRPMRSEINLKFLLKLSPNMTRIQSEKPGPIYNFAAAMKEFKSVPLQFLICAGFDRAEEQATNSDLR